MPLLPVLSVRSTYVYQSFRHPVVAYALVLPLVNRQEVKRGLWTSAQGQFMVFFFCSTNVNASIEKTIRICPSVRTRNSSVVSLSDPVAAVYSQCIFLAFFKLVRSTNSTADRNINGQMPQALFES